MAEDKLKELDSYFGIHCELPAGMIRDLFDEAFKFRAEIEQLTGRLAKADALIERTGQWFEQNKEKLRENDIGGFQTTKDSAPFKICANERRQLDPLEKCSVCGGVGYHINFPR